MIRGVVSIGTNSTRALVAAFDGEVRILLTRSIGTRIGEGLKERGHLDEAAMQRTLEAVREHTQAVRELTSDIHAIATSALRRADNGDDFAQRVREITGATLEIISGEEEARRSFIGAVSGIDAPKGASFGVLDTGGGSSEYAGGTKRGPEHIVSCEIGAVRLTEALPQLAGTTGAVEDATLERAQALAREALVPIKQFAAVDRLVFVGGSATTAVSVQREERQIFSYADLTRADIQRLIDLLRTLKLEDRKALPGMNPQRADILLAGLIIIDVVFDLTGHGRSLVSTNDLLLGTLLL